ncbi:MULTISPECIES: MoaD/ThiS family protein [Amycolatopsis]|uniref:MoaD/ThiS family protein n=1 Tax=Amycolatopsis TaxID=1813 RepID=UPI001C56C64F|nr:MoaD/ThiS family protein [Amycolatopsis sp. TNS106]QXV55770.1 MoaD/ThiS family protein [Amycolatopsis sp. TNS106]
MNIEFTGILLRAANNTRTVTLEATTLASALAELTTRFPAMDRVLLDNTGNLRKAHRVFLNGELVPHPERGMPLSTGDRIEFFTAVAGG